MTTEQELKKIIKEEILALFKEDDVTYDDQLVSIEKALFQIKDLNAQGNEKGATQMISVLMPQIMSMGFDKPHLSKMQHSIKNMMTDKDVYLILSTYKLMGEGKYDSPPREDIYKYKVIVSIPFSTSKNKDEKISQLKYDLVTSGIKILGIKELPVAELAKAGEDSVIQLHILMMLQTYKKRTELETGLQPTYKLIKIKNITDSDE
jgi:hypothetical protein